MNRCLLILLLLMPISQFASASSQFLLGRPSTVYQLENELLADFLHDFLKDQGMRALISPSLKNESRLLNGTQSGTPDRIFSRVIASNALIFYVDGLSVYVYKAEEAKREFLMVPSQKTGLLKRSLSQMGIGDDENLTKIDSSTGVIEIAGTPRYVEQVRGLTDAVFDQLEGDSRKEMTLHHFPLKYAWASDRAFTVGTGQVTVSGVATVLQQALYGSHQASQPDSSGYSSVKRVGSREGRARNQSSLSAEQQAVTRAADYMAEGVLQPPSSLGALSYTTSGPAIVASSQQNAIIVRDYPNRIYLYKNLIAALDTPSQIVEIEATIMDVNTDKLRNLGIEWRYSGNESNGEVMFTKDATKKNFIDTLAGNSVSVLDQIPGFQIGAIIGDKNQFIARINALEEEGVVSVSSRPKVATLNDLEAVIESSTSFYVPVNGAYDVDLFQVLTGTVLRVTPHLITHDWGTQIRLIVAIEDGSVAGVNNGIPVTKRHAVTTQALVNTGHSLLLGGLVREEEEASDYKVPYLGDIPWLGNFFKSQFKSKGQSERLFLISPRIVAPDGSDQAEAKKQPLSRLPKDPDCKGKCQLELSDEQPLVF